MVRVFGLVGRIADAAALVTQALFHRHPVVAGVDELHLALAVRLLAVGQRPDVSTDAGVVEKLLGERDDGLEPIVLDDPAADLRFAPASIPGEQRRAVEDDADAAPAV